MKTSNPKEDGAATPFSSRRSNLHSRSVAAVVSYIRQPESGTVADRAAAVLYPIVADQTRRQCRCSDWLFPADLHDLTQAAMIRLFTKQYLIGNQRLQDSINKSDEEARVACFIRCAVAAAVRISVREFLRDPVVRSRKRAARDGAEGIEINELADERACGDGSVELRNLCREYLGRATEDEHRIVQLRADGMTTNEIAAVLELRPQRVKTLLKALRRRLVHKLSSHVSKLLPSPRLQPRKPQSQVEP